MSTGRTLYHVLFYRLLKDRGPAGFTFLFEQPLTVDLQKADIIIVRKTGAPGATENVILPRLWPLLPTDTIAEYKSPSRGFRSGDLARLLGYAGQYHSDQMARVQGAANLATVLVVSSMTRALEDELALFGVTRKALGGGYYATDAKPYPLYLTLVDEVAESEHDALLDIVGHRTMTSDDASAWVIEHTLTRPEEPNMEKLEGYDELVAKALARLPASVRVAGMSAEERLLALDDDQLAGLSAAYVSSLPEAVQAEIKRRLTKH